jgi:SAM-dependent methyltransferase
VKRLAVSLLRALLRPFKWDVAPAPVLAEELNNTAVIRAVTRSLASRVRAEITARGLEVAPLWLERIEDEIQFWFGYFATDGIEYGGRTSIERLAGPHPFQYESLFAGVPGASTLSVLDVGAGPLSQIGTVGIRADVRLQAVDPLAPAYDAVLQFFRISPPVVTKFGIAERLIGQFPERQFDLVHARNALDHALDPFRCIHEMAALVKPGGWIVLDHTDCEADHQGFQGLHQWNFSVVGDRYQIEGAQRQVQTVDHEKMGFSMRFEHYFSNGKQCTRVYFQRRQL